MRGVLVGDGAPATAASVDTPIGFTAHLLRDTFGSVMRTLARSPARIAPIQVLLSAMLVACGGGDHAAPTTASVPVVSEGVATVTIGGVPGSVVVGNSVTLMATLKNSAGTVLSNRSVSWRSGDTTVVRVSAAGVATAVLPGPAAVTATSEGVSATITFGVVAPALSQNSGGFTGYFTGPIAAPATGFGYGFSRYNMIHTVQAVPLTNMQFGITTWIAPDNRTFNSPLCPVGTYARDHWPERGPSYRDVYQTIEGGTGNNAGARFPTGTIKLHTGGTPDCYTTTMNTPAWGNLGVLLTQNQTGLAIVGNRLLRPPDGTNFSPAAGLGLVGIGWLALPIIPAYTSALGVPTGDRNPTLFLNAANFKGPVAFFTNAIYSQVNASDNTGVGRGLDAQPMYTGSIGMEVGSVRWIPATKNGVRYGRVPRLSFATDASGRATFAQDMTYYSRTALWDAMLAWMNGGAAATALDATGAASANVATASAGLTLDGMRVGFDTASFNARAFRTEGNGPAIGLGWGASTTPTGVIPEYYRLSGTAWTPVAASDVPRDTWLADQTFPASTGNTPYADATPLFPQATWRAGPFTTRLLDGSTVDYVWVKFTEQVAIARLNLSSAVLQRMQTWVEALHQASGVNGITIPAPSSGRLATIDAGQVVTPPTGFEKGYVLIVIRQR